MTPTTYSPRFTSRHQPTRSSSSGALRLGKASGRILGIILLALMALLYVAQVSKGAAQQTAVEQAKVQVDTLTEQQREISAQATRLQSLNSYAQSTDALGLVPVDHVDTK